MRKEENMYFKNREEKIAFITQYFQQSCREDKDRALGFELEHFVIDKKSKKRIFVHEGVKDILDELNQSGAGDPESQGIARKNYSYTIEPGAQFEISVTKADKIQDLEKFYKEAIGEVWPLLEKRGYSLLNIGVDPVNAWKDIPIISKKRYHLMNNYFEGRGELSRSMMRQSCALQIAIDYASEEDFIKKFRVLTALVPILYSLFDNSPYFEGKKIVHYNFRQWIWTNTDPARTGIFKKVFDEDFSFSSYAKWLLDVPMIFLPKAEPIPFEESLDIALDQVEGKEEALAYLEHALSIVFPDIRVKKYLEIRPMDSVPLAYSLGAVALIKGLFYHQENFDHLVEEFSPMTTAIVERGKEAGKDNGIQAYYFSKYMANWGLELSEMARKGLSEEEGKYLAPLKDLWDQLLSPRGLFEKIERKEGYTSALEAFEVRV